MINSMHICIYVCVHPFEVNNIYLLGGDILEIRKICWTMLGPMSI